MKLGEIYTRTGKKMLYVMIIRLSKSYMDLAVLFDASNYYPKGTILTDYKNSKNWKKSSFEEMVSKYNEIHNN